MNPGVPDFEEVEGISDSPPGRVLVQGVPVNVHFLLLDRDEPGNLDDVEFKHVALPSPADLWDF